MATKTTSNDSPDRKRGSRSMSPRAQRIFRQAQSAGQSVPRYIFPQWLRTALLVMAWLGSIPMYVQLVSPYSTILSARSMAVGLAMFAGIAPHVWKTRTAPWRTVIWAFALSALTGMALLLAGAEELALTGATIVGFAVVVLRINENGRKLVDLVKTWRAVR